MAIHGASDGLANAGVSEGAGGRVEVEVHDGRAGGGFVGEARGVLEDVDHVEGDDVDCDIGGAFLELEGGGDCVGDDREAKMLDAVRWGRGGVRPVVRGAVEDDFLVHGFALEAKGARADGAEAEVLARAAWDYAEEAVAKVEEE